MGRSFCLLSLVALGAVASAQVHTPPPGSRERAAILNGVRPFEGGSKAKVAVEALKVEGQYAYLQGRTATMQNYEESWGYFLGQSKTNGLKWQVLGKFTPYHEGQAAGWLQAFDFRLLRVFRFPPKLVPQVYRKYVEKGWYAYGIGFQSSGTATLPLSDAQMKAISNASHVHPAIVKGYKAFQVASVEAAKK